MDDNKNFPIAEATDKDVSSSAGRPQRKKALPRLFRSVLAIIAAILLVAVGIFVWQFYSLSPSRIFKANYQPYILSEVNHDSTMTETLFREKRYYELAKSKNTENFTARDIFLQSMSWLQLYNYDKAITGLKKIIDNNQATGTHIMNDEAEYYLALSFIADKDFDLALPLLNKMYNNPDHAYHDKISAKLIRQVKMLKWR
jgi:tetratricopeptide (TPR) repeat protein